MIVVKLEMWPHGREEYKYSLGEIRIINDGTGDVGTGNYNAEIMHAGKHVARPGVWKRSRVAGFIRGLSPYRLLARVLLAAGEK